MKGKKQTGWDGIIEGRRPEERQLILVLSTSQPVQWLSHGFQFSFFSRLLDGRAL